MLTGKGHIRLFHIWRLSITTTIIIYINSILREELEIYEVYL
jgi:hypothetical protein